MREKQYVDRIFAGYEDTQEIRDFKEEITVNLQERVKEFVASGLSEEDAFEKAIGELGDITQIADQIGKQRRKEAINRMYMGNRIPVSKGHAVGYAICALLSLFGLFSGIGVFFASRTIFAAIATFTVFVSVSAGYSTFLGLTQETRLHLPMTRRRAFFYGISVGLIVFGVGMAISLAFLRVGTFVITGPVIAFVLPAVAILTFLGLTEKSRLKPWAEKEREIHKNYWAKYNWGKFWTPENLDIPHIIRFGILSGVLWTTTVAIFLTLGFVFSFGWSWLIFMFAIPVELLMVSKYLFGQRNEKD